MEDDDVEEEDISSDIKESHQDMMSHEYSESTVSPQQPPTDGPSNASDALFLENEPLSTFEIPGDMGDRTKDGMTSINADYNFVGSFDNELPSFGFGQHLEEFANVGNKLD